MLKIVKQTNSKVCGAKFTCGNIGKLTRVARATNAVSTTSTGSGWMVFGGIADFTIQCAASGGSGMLVGGANVFPKLNVKTWNLWTEGKYEEAMELQRVLSDADWVCSKYAIAGTKAAIELFDGYGGFPRRPLQRVSEEERREIKERLGEAMRIEGTL
jgi:L-threo-3-deoxy-hexylosonate aldolase